MGTILTRLWSVQAEIVRFDRMHRSAVDLSVLRIFFCGPGQLKWVFIRVLSSPTRTLLS